MKNVRLLRFIVISHIDVLIASAEAPDSRSVADHARKHRLLLVQL